MAKKSKLPDGVTTFDGARAWCAARGYSLSKSWGDYRVARRVQLPATRAELQKVEAEAYYTNDLADAMHTCVAMQRVANGTRGPSDDRDDMEAEQRERAAS